MNEVANEVADRTESEIAEQHSTEQNADTLNTESMHGLEETAGPAQAALTYEGTLSDQAFSAMQLRSQPFEGVPIASELFADEQTFGQINELRQALLSGDSLLFLSGKTGSGKSTLLKQLTHQSGQRLHFFSVRGNDQYSTRNLFNGMLDSWKLTPPLEFEDTVKELILSLQATQERNMIVVIMIDDADKVPASELHILLSAMQYINSGDDLLLRLILSSEPEFEPTIPDLLPEGSNLPYSSLNVEPFHASRARPYMEFRLNQAGYYERFPFDDRHVNTIANDALGLPGRINALAAESLNVMFSEQGRAMPKSGFMAKIGAFFGISGNKLGKILLGLLALGLILAGLLYKSPSAPTRSAENPYKVVETKPVASNTTNDTSKNRLQMVQEKAPVVSIPARTTENSNITTPNSTQSNGSETSTQASGRSAAQIAAQVTVQQPERQTDAAPSGNSNVVAQDPLKAATAEIKEAVAKNSTSVTASTSTSNSSAATSTATTTRPPTPTAKPAASTPTPNEADTAQSNTTKTPERQTDTSNAASGMESANWVLLQNPKLYTIQMSASTDRPSVEAFLRRSSLNGPNSIFSFQRNGKTWFALVHGIYPSIKDARATIENMTKSARSNQPWIREIGRIQQALKSSN